MSLFQVRPNAALASGKSTEKRRQPCGLLVVPFAASLFLATTGPAQAGFLSGSRGWGSIPLPSVPTPEQIKQIQEKEKKRYADFDANLKKSPFVEELKKRSRDNAVKNKQRILDKYCERQAEWGVGDCSLEASTPEEREKFMELLKQKREQ